VIKLWARTVLAAALMTTGCKASAAAPMTLADYMALNGPAPSAHIAYGSAPSQYVELFEPAGQGPFPVVVLVHGGCWSKDLEGIVQMRDMAGALAARGVAVWNVEYRRADEAGGGYPGTYQDINAALAALQANAGRYRLDTRRIVAMGHSAGGHLVQWIAGRSRLPATSPLKVANPLPIREIISLGGLADLRGQAEQIRTACDIDVARLTGAPSAARPDPFADTSAAELIPNGSHAVLINGELDAISPPAVASAYAQLARKAGDQARTIVLPNASHFDEVATGSPAWKIVLPVVLKALGEPAPK
jgi:acetyl esterase/lipase